MQVHRGAGDIINVSGGIINQHCSGTTTVYFLIFVGFAAEKDVEVGSEEQ